MRSIPVVLRLGPAACLIAALAAGTCFADERVRRGRYFRCADFGFELWIPQGFAPGKFEPARTEYGVTVGIFHGARPGVYAISLRMWKGESVETCAGVFEKEFPCRFEVQERLSVGGRAAIIYSRTELDKVEGFRGTEIAEAGVKLDTHVVRVLVHCTKGRLEPALRIVRWIVATVRMSGDDGLDPWLGPRRVDPETGLSWRTPRGWTRQAGEGAISVLTDPGARLRITLTRKEGGDPATVLEAAESKATQRWGPIRFPSDHGLEILGAESVGSDGKGRVCLAARKSDDRTVFLLTAEGGDKPERRVRCAERVAMSLRRFEVAAMRSRVKAAIKDLKHALSTKDFPAARAPIAVLAEGAFLDEAADALLEALPRLGDETRAIEAARALRSADPVRVARLLRLARHPRLSRSPKVVTALYESIEEVSRTSDIVYLLRQARSARSPVAAAAIDTLGRAADQRERVIGDLITLMAAHEKAATRGDRDARDRALELRPALQAALHRLTGQTFDSSAAARKWRRDERSRR